MNLIQKITFNGHKDFPISKNDTQFAEHSLSTISNANPSHFWSLSITSGQ